MLTIGADGAVSHQEVLALFQESQTALVETAQGSGVPGIQDGKSTQIIQVLGDTPWEVADYRVLPRYIPYAPYMTTHDAVERDPRVHDAKVDARVAEIKREAKDDAERHARDKAANAKSDAESQQRQKAADAEAERKSEESLRNAAIYSKASAKLAVATALGQKGGTVPLHQFVEAGNTTLPAGATVRDTQGNKYTLTKPTSSRGMLDAITYGTVKFPTTPPPKVAGKPGTRRGRG